MPADAGSLAGIERHPDSLGGIEPSQAVDDQRADPMRRAVIADIERDEPGEGLRHRVGAGQIGVWPFLTEAADRDVKQPLVARRQRVVAEPEPRRDSRPEALDDDVGAFRERDGDFPCGGGFEIERQALLAAVELRRHRGVVAIAHAEPTRPVAGGRLQLDDLSAVHRQEHRAIGRRNSLAEIEDAQAGVGRIEVHRFKLSLRAKRSDEPPLFSEPDRYRAFGGLGGAGVDLGFGDRAERVVDDDRQRGRACRARRAAPRPRAGIRW